MLKFKSSLFAKNISKKIITCALAAFTITSLAACGSTNSSAQAGAGNAGAGSSNTAQTVQQTEFSGNNSGSKILVAYFSYFDNTDSDKITSKRYADAMSSASVTVVDGKRRGNNDIVADILKEQTGADVFSILTKEQYSPDYDGGIVEQARIDGQNKVKPELASHIANLDQYDTVIILFPTWWYDMPMAMYTFFDEYDFTGKTIAPIATSGGSGLVDTVNTIKQLEPGANVTEGLSIMQNAVSDSASDIASWLNRTGIKTR